MVSSDRGSKQKCFKPNQEEDWGCTSLLLLALAFFWVPGSSRELLREFRWVGPFAVRDNEWWWRLATAWLLTQRRVKDTGQIFSPSLESTQSEVDFSLGRAATYCKHVVQCTTCPTIHRGAACMKCTWKSFLLNGSNYKQAHQIWFSRYGTTLFPSTFVVSFIAIGFFLKKLYLDIVHIPYN